MANAVNYLAQIQTGQTIQAVHVNQFVNALSGSVAYDLVTSGSYRIIGPLYATASWATNALNANSSSYALSSSFATTSSFTTTASYAVSSTSALSSSYAVSASKVFIADNGSTDLPYTLVFKNDAGALNDYYQLAADGTNGPYYNPSTNVLGGLGGLTVSGSIGRFTSITGSLSGSVTGNLTGTATSASYAATASISGTATSTGLISGYYIPSGSATAVAGLLKMFAGAGKTGATPPYTSVVTVTPLDLTGKTLNQNLFLGIAPSQSSATVSVTLSSPSSITFVSNVASTDFTFVATYI
jgi:hypothetical protein